MNGEVKLICAAYTDAYTARRKINRSIPLESAENIAIFCPAEKKNR